MNPVMLSVSTFRWSDKAVEEALRRASQTGTLAVVYVVDRNLARYLIGTDFAHYRNLREKCEEDLLGEHEVLGRQRLGAIEEKGKALGIDVRTDLRVGRFAEIELERVKALQPSVVVTTRSQRPAWVRKFFGSPVSRLEAEAGCSVVEV